MVPLTHSQNVDNLVSVVRSSLRLLWGLLNHVFGWWKSWQHLKKAKKMLRYLCHNETFVLQTVVSLTSSELFVKAQHSSDTSPHQAISSHVRETEGRQWPILLPRKRESRANLLLFVLTGKSTTVKIQLSKCKGFNGIPVKKSESETST